MIVARWGRLSGDPHSENLAPRRKVGVLLRVQKLFVVNYADGSRAFLRVPHEIAAFGVSPPVMKLVREVQARGEIPAGDIASLIAAR